MGEGGVASFLCNTLQDILLFDRGGSYSSRFLPDYCTQKAIIGLFLHIFLRVKSMEDKHIEQKNVKKKRVSLNTVYNVAKYMSKKIREFENDQEREKHLQEYRTAGFLVAKLIDCYRLKYELNIEQRIEAIEKRLEEGNDSRV
jgi:hypothetical protein